MLSFLGGIKQKLILFSVVILLITSIGLGILAIYSSSQALLEETEKALVYKAEDNAQIISERIKSAMEKLEVVATKQDIVSMDRDRQQIQLREELQRDGSYQQLTAFNLEGQALISDGTVLDLSDDVYFNQAYEENQTVISDVFISPVTNQPAVVIATPIRENNAIRGVLLARLNATFLSDITADIVMGETGYAYVINDEGTVIGHKERQFVLDQMNILEEANSNDAFVDLAKAIENMITGDKIGFERYEYDGHVRHMGYALIEGTDWFIAVQSFEDELLSGIYALRNQLILSIAFFIVLGSVITYILGNKFSKPIIELSNFAETLSQSDLTQNVSKALLKKTDEIGTLANTLEQVSQNTRKMILEINTSAEQVTQSAYQMSNSAAEASKAAEETATAIQEVAQGAETHVISSEESANAMEEMASGIQQIAKSSSNIADFSNQTKERVLEGNQSVKGAIQQINDVSDRTDTTMNIVKELKQDSEQIGEITQLITDIANQTNLLALNAAIEAARAGEAGKGFAVVAEEIRKLSDQTGSSASTINQLIAHIQGNVSNSFDAMDESSKGVESSKVMINQVGQVFTDILYSVEQVTEQVEELSAISEEMSASSEEVMASVQEMSGSAQIASGHAQQVAAATEEQLATMEEITSTSEDLSDLATQLKDMIHRFKVK